MPLLATFESELPGMLDDISALVRCESPSGERSAVRAAADTLAAVAAPHLGEPERLDVDGCPHLRWRLGDGPRRVLLLGHVDTVWPRGTLDRLPWSNEDGVLRGPGCFDMKAGLVMALRALTALADTDGVTLLVTGDEEIGSPTSRALIEAEARGCVAALVLEAAGDGGALKLERKGVSLYEVEITGRAAHAGLEPHLGVNAGLELAAVLPAVAALADAGQGTTVTPTRLSGGTTTNTVPASATFSVDVRVRSGAEQDRVDTAIRALTPTLPGARLTVHGGPNRPPLPASASDALFGRAQRVAAELGLPAVHGIAVGGASDGNYTAGVGTPTLDGLGATGGGAHADDEHVLVADLAARTALLAGLLADLLGTRVVRSDDGALVAGAATDGVRS